MLQRIRKATEDREQGFTLVELLVVVIIIGILAAIAIPAFLNQREKAWERAALSDLRNSSATMESFFADNNTYVGATGFRESTDVDVVLSAAGADAATTTGYCLEATHTRLSGQKFVLRSSDGKAQKVTSTVVECT